MRKIIYILFILIVILFIGYRYIALRHIHTNPKYDFSFAIPSSTKLESRGNAFTCGRNQCGDFSGNPGFHYSIFQPRENKFTAGVGDYFIHYSFVLKNGKIYKAISVAKDGTIINHFSDNDLFEATPYITNQYGVSFYSLAPEYCTYTDKIGYTQICFTATNRDNTASETEELQKVFETFRFK